MSYEIISEKLGFDKLPKLYQSGLVFDEIVGCQIPFYEGLGFPPAMLPLASAVGNASYFGAYLYDINNLDCTFVELMLDEEELYEVGLNEQQFCYFLVRRAMLDYYEEDNEFIINQISRFCSLLNVEDWSVIGDLSQEEFLQLEIFDLGVPRYLKLGKNGTTLGNTGFQSRVKTESVHLDYKSEFDAAFMNQDFQKAWNILNTPGWNFDDAKVRFKLLTEQVNNEVMTELYNSWIQLNHPVQGY